MVNKLFSLGLITYFYTMKNPIRIIELLNKEDIKNIKNLKVHELIILCSLEVSKNKEKQTLNENKVVAKYNNSYLKIFKVDGLFGETLELIKIDSLKPSGYTEQYERTYSLKGEIIIINKHNIGIRTFDTSVHSYYTLKDLENCIKTNKKEWSKYLTIQKEIQSNLLDLIKYEKV